MHTATFQKGHTDETVVLKASEPVLDKERFFPYQVVHEEVRLYSTKQG